jgi:hypothetical protein
VGSGSSSKKKSYSFFCLVSALTFVALSTGIPGVLRTDARLRSPFCVLAPSKQNNKLRAWRREEGLDYDASACREAEWAKLWSQGVSIVEFVGGDEWHVNKTFSCCFPSDNVNSHSEEKTFATMA